ncbi:hypothetical protein [Pedobacter agri]|uniref:hypothetical protein n=1 Tax=Pedobacter agri TaxID=454586 RepID=UPI002784ECF0|nr:hypothetical protein [Pedobacter agri]MDQ1141740.1 hypothetical protein [Pedobacter agri]
MKKMWIGIGIIFILGFGIYIFFPTEKLVLERNNEPVDSRYSAFQVIDEHYNSVIFEVKRVARVVVSSAASPNPIRIFPSVNHQLILDCDAKVDEDTKHDIRYYKIDQRGTVIDSIYVAYNGHWGQFINDFMVYTGDKNSYYNTWPLNGDTTGHKVVELNADLSWDADRVEAKIKVIKSAAKYYFFNSLSNENVWYRQCYFYADKKWQLLWQKMPGYTQIPDEESASRYRKDVFRSGEVSFEIPKDVKLLHFHPEEKMKYSHIIGGGDGGFSVYNWRGKGFFETTVADKNFQFMVTKLIVEKEKHNGYRPSLFTVEEAGAATNLYKPAFYHSSNGFSFYSPNAKELFLIKLKK